MLDHTQTRFGRRLLRSWLGKPLRHRPAILARLDAVQELTEQGERSRGQELAGWLSSCLACGPPQLGLPPLTQATSMPAPPVLPAGDSHPVLSRLGATLKKLPDLERGRGKA